LLAAVIFGVLSNARAGHPLTDFSVYGYHLTGSTGTLFLFGIAVGAVASLGLCLLLTGMRPTGSREADAPHEHARASRQRHGRTGAEMKAQHANADVLH
jgi:hypothetical protein